MYMTGCDVRVLRDRRRFSLLTACAIFFLPLCLYGQENEKEYVRETDPNVSAKIHTWQDLKFGIMFHWGIYSQWGIVESWSVCGEDEGWCERRGPFAADYEKYKEAYYGLQKTFNPVKFNPAAWARAAHEAGMRYLVFTTKHHDGFCMFDTKTTTRRITAPDCPFSTDPRANITREVFSAFRAEDLMIGAYLSKPDWGSEYYWWPYFPTPDRHVNYDPAKYPDRWNNFREYTYRQIEELTTGYGKVDILWLDGAWVRPHDPTPAEYMSWAIKKEYNQDIDIPRLAAMARKNQPGLIFVDRWVSGRYENYLTPEQKMPDRPLNVPWEAVMTMAGSWSYVPDDHYKSTRDLIALLVNVVAKGGNLLLNVGVSPEGTLSDTAYARMKELGEWMRINGGAIYATHAVAPYKVQNICFTATGDTALHAIWLATGGEKAPPPRIVLHGLPQNISHNVRMLGVSAPLPVTVAGDSVTIQLPSKVQKSPPCRFAWCFTFDLRH
jgi:alpha-L-fucosidase